MESAKKKQKVLLMGKSGSGKSSMRSIIFSNYVAKDVRRLGATIDVEHSHVKFMGNLTLNLWDCGGQDAFMETYLASQRENIFSDVAVLIYVFDIESREVERDMDTYNAIIKALGEYSPHAYVFGLIHKMDLIPIEHRRRAYDERSELIRHMSEDFRVDTFGSSIWDQSLYLAWAGIVHKLIPNLWIIEKFLEFYGRKIQAEEVVLFERSTFLAVTTWVSEQGKINPSSGRFERLSNVYKTYKQSCARNTNTSASVAGFGEMQLKTQQFNMFLTKFTDNTYLFVVLPAGDVAYFKATTYTHFARQKLAKKYLEDSITNPDLFGPGPYRQYTGLMGIDSREGSITSYHDVGGSEHGAEKTNKTTVNGASNGLSVPATTEEDASVHHIEVAAPSDPNGSHSAPGAPGPISYASAVKLNEGESVTEATDAKNAESQSDDR